MALKFKIQLKSLFKHYTEDKLLQNWKIIAMTPRKVILITGGNNGIGYETVKAFLHSDKAYHILLGSRSLEKAKLAVETLYQECPESTNTIEVVQIDVTSDESIEKAFERIRDSLGHIDALINNAGIYTSL